MSHSAGSLRGGSPSISLQLVMHMLSTADALRFARSCKATLAAASCTFAWPHMVFFALYNVGSTMQAMTWKTERIERSLLRFARNRGIRVNDRGESPSLEELQMIRELTLMPRVSVIHNNASYYECLSLVSSLVTHATIYDKITVYTQAYGIISLDAFHAMLRRQKNMHTMDVGLYRGTPTYQCFRPHTNMTDLTIRCQWSKIQFDLGRAFPSLVRFHLRAYDSIPMDEFPWKTIQLPSTTEELCLPTSAFPPGMWPELVRLFPSVRRFTFDVYDTSDKMDATSLAELYHTLDAHPFVSVQLLSRMIYGEADVLGCTVGVGPHARFTIVTRDE